MSWPTPAEINEAIQNPQLSFKDQDLCEGKAEMDSLGIPVARSGSNADVYCFFCGTERVAVKCFTRPIAQMEQRYQAIHNALSKFQMSFTVDFSYRSEGLWLRDQWYPLVRMQWVDGIRLNDFARSMIGRGDILQNLIQILAKMNDWLSANNIGHCDLQHGNILLIPHSDGRKLSIRLVDYDGMWVPALSHEPPQEFGHPDYQHPERMAKNYYGPAADRFSLLAIATGLRALSVHGQALWQRYDNSVNIVFQQQDFVDPHRSPLFDILSRSPDETLRRLCGTLADACGASIEKVPHLTDVLNGVSSRGTTTVVKTEPISTPSPATVVKASDQLEKTDDRKEADPPAAPQQAKLPERSAKRKRTRKKNRKPTGINKLIWAAGSVSLLLFGFLLLWAFGVFKFRNDPAERERTTERNAERNAERTTAGWEDDGRELWVHSPGYFVRGLGTDWFEKSQIEKQPARRFVEVQRTTDYVELRQTDGSVIFQLYADKAMRPEPFGRAFDGEWQSTKGASTGSVGRAWVHSHGYFLQGMGTDWFEKYADGEKPPMRFKQLRATDEFVELRNAAHPVIFRLHKDRALMQNENSKKGFQLVYRGKWQDRAD